MVERLGEMRKGRIENGSRAAACLKKFLLLGLNVQ